MRCVDATYLTQPGDRGLHKKLLKKRLGPLRVLEAFHSDRQMALPVGDRGAPSAYRLQTPKQWKAVAPRCGVVVRDETFEAMGPGLTFFFHSLFWGAFKAM